MTWELFEVWGVDREGYEELIETTRSFKEARLLAEKSLTEDIVEVIIYREVDEELKEFEKISKPVDKQ